MSANSTKIDKSLELRPQVSAPTSPAIGEIYNSSTLGLQQWTGTAWVNVGSASVPQVAFTLANNQVAAADITGLLIDQAVNKSFRLDYMIRRRYAGSTIVAGTEDTAWVSSIGTGSNGSVTNAKLQADGKLLVYGQFGSFSGLSYRGIVRINANGTMDTTNLATTLNSGVTDMVIQPDTKIVIVGGFTSWGGVTRGQIVRMNADGTDDTTFTANSGTGFSSAVNCIAQQTDGKLIVSGIFSTYNGTTANRIARLNTDGTLDTAFQTNIGTGPNTRSYSCFVQPDGKMVFGGAFTTYQGASRNRLVRLNADGTPDTAFNTNLGTGFNSTVNCIAQQTDGKILVVGDFTTFNGNTRNRIVRLNGDGTEDTAFATAMGTGFDAQVNGVTVAPDGSIYIGGTFTTWNGNTRNRLIKVSSAGVEDTAYYTATAAGANNSINGVFVYPDGKAVICGDFTTWNGVTRGRITRLNTQVVIPNTQLYEKGSLLGYYNIDTASWILGDQEFIGSESGILISITAAGQLQYTSTNISVGTLVESSLTGALYKL